MKAGGIVALVVVLFLVITPAIILSSTTNLLALAISGGANQDVYLYSGPPVIGDDYDFGNCTWWVAYLRMKINDPIPNTWGNAITWAYRAKADGYMVDHIPSYSAIMQDPNAPGGLGHVAFVTRVDQMSGAWTISEMNRVGFDEVDTRDMSAADALAYNFIHDKGVQ
jgi:surface antigen